jgi:ParB-like chromosome segregation protein Spo0J
MNVVGLKEVPLSTVRLPGDFKKRLDAPHVAERAKSLEGVGLIHEPLVRRKGKQWEVIAGLDRIAAHFVAKRESVSVKVVECTDAEVMKIRREENVQRRHDKEEQSRLMTELLEQYTSEEEDRIDSPKKARAKARERVAAELGLSPETIRKKEWEAEQKTEPVGPPIKTLGMSLSEDFAKKVALAQRGIDATEALLKRAQSTVTTMAKELGLAFPQARLERLREEIHAQASHCRGLRPVSLCPWCKGLDGVQEGCGACFGTGFITASQENAVPAELLNEAIPVVLVDGNYEDVHEFLPYAQDLDIPRGDDPIAGDEPLGDEW